MSFSDNINSVEVSYEVAPAPLSLSPAIGHVGSSVTVSGKGFAASSTITITYDGAAITTTPATVTTTARGSFQAIISVPAGTAGGHTITASDAAGNAVQATFDMESTPPPAPSPLAPEYGSRVGAFGPERPPFAWSEVSDPSGVTYTLQIAIDPEFTKLEVNREGLDTTTYTPDQNEALGKGQYYWRVKAIDGASNESEWSETATFTVGFLPAWMPLWLFIVFIVLGVGIIGGAVYLVLMFRPVS
jgi:hypothetical protein